MRMITSSQDSVPIMAARNRFGSYKPEADRKSRIVKVTQSESLSQLKEAYAAYLKSYNERTENPYASALMVIKNLECGPEDVVAFSIVLEEFQNCRHFDATAGLFLSALVNTGMHKDYLIHTAHLDISHPLPYVGHKNRKNLIVEGDVGSLSYGMSGGSIIVNGNAGNSIGREMTGGSITVNGNAGDAIGMQMTGGSITVNGNTYSFAGLRMSVGSIIVNGDTGTNLGYAMAYGSITINGNAHDFVGREMTGGTIIVTGNAGIEVGLKMKGGEIFIEGDFRNLADNIEGGRIFHKGKLILEK